MFGRKKKPMGKEEPPMPWPDPPKVGRNPPPKSKLTDHKKLKPVNIHIGDEVISSNANEVVSVKILEKDERIAIEIPPEITDRERDELMEELHEFQKGQKRFLVFATPLCLTVLEKAPPKPKLKSFEEWKSGCGFFIAQGLGMCKVGQTPEPCRQINCPTYPKQASEPASTSSEDELILYVHSEHGDDISGTGSIHQPFRSKEKAKDTARLLNKKAHIVEVHHNPFEAKESFFIPEGFSNQDMEGDCSHILSQEEVDSEDLGQPSGPATYECGHCGHKGPSKHPDTLQELGASPWCSKCGKNDKLVRQ